MRDELPPELQNLPLKSTRPGTSTGPAPTPRRPARTTCTTRPRNGFRSLDDRELFRRIAISFRVCRIYAQDHRHQAELAAALDRLTGTASPDETTKVGAGRKGTGTICRDGPEGASH